MRKALIETLWELVASTFERLKPFQPTIVQIAESEGMIEKVDRGAESQLGDKPGGCPGIENPCSR